MGLSGEKEMANPSWIRHWGQACCFNRRWEPCAVYGLYKQRRPKHWNQGPASSNQDQNPIILILAVRFYNGRTLQSHNGYQWTAAPLDSYGGNSYLDWSTQRADFPQECALSKILRWSLVVRFAYFDKKKFEKLTVICYDEGRWCPNIMRTL